MRRGPMPQRTERVIGLRATWEETWSPADRLWWRDRETCRCDRPVAGPRYLGAVTCVKCSKYIRTGGMT